MSPPQCLTPYPLTRMWPMRLGIPSPLLAMWHMRLLLSPLTGMLLMKLTISPPEIYCTRFLHTPTNNDYNSNYSYALHHQSTGDATPRTTERGNWCVIAWPCLFLVLLSGGGGGGGGGGDANHTWYSKRKPCGGRCVYLTPT